MFPTRRTFSLLRKTYSSSLRCNSILVTAHNKRILQMKNNYALFNSISKDYPEGTYLGILDGKLVATADSYSRIADKLGCKLVECMCRFIHFILSTLNERFVFVLCRIIVTYNIIVYLMSNKSEDEVHVIPSPFRVGCRSSPIECPQISEPESAYLPALDWREVAKAYPNELLEDVC